MAEVKKSRGGTGLRIILTILIILAAAAGIVLIAFRVKTIEINGTHRVSEAEIKRMIRLEECHGNTLLLWMMNREIDVSDVDMIEKMEMTITGPGSVRIDVEEQLLVGFFRQGAACCYVNENGLVILTQQGEIENVPELKGLEINELQQGGYVESENAAALKDMLQIAAIIQETGLIVETLEVDEDGHYMISWQQIKALLGRNVYMNEKIGELLSLQQQEEISGQAGTFHLEEYDATKDAIIFTKD